MASFAACGGLQGNVSKQQSEQEQGLRDLQGLVGAALAVPKEVVQPAFASLGKRHLAILTEQRKLQLQPAFVTAVAQCIGVPCNCPCPFLVSWQKVSHMPVSMHRAGIALPILQTFSLVAVCKFI